MSISKELEEAKKLNMQLKSKQAELEETLKLQAARQIQSEHDKAEALKAKAQLQPQEDKTGISIVSTMPTQADLVEGSMLQILNAKRVSKGLAPFKNYSDYIAPVKTEFITQANNKSDPVTPLNKLGDESLDFGGQPLKANGNVYHIISGGYYVAWNKSRCYIQKQETSEVDILVHGDTLYGESALMSMIPNKSFRDLTRMEVDSIVSGKPSYKSLFMAYSKLRNFQNVTIDTLNALPIW